MINLLPPETKKTTTYARRNTQLVRACLAVVGVTIGALLIIGAGHFYLATTTSRYQQDVVNLQASLQSQDLEGTKKKIQDLSGSIKLVVQVLSKEILFSKLLRQAGSVMPNGSSLNTIEVSDDQKGIDISAGVRDYQVGTQVQINLADPDNKLFDKVDLVSVECNTVGTSQYPCTATLRALFGDSSPYLFINGKTGN
jgi:hypothetical protein